MIENQTQLFQHKEFGSLEILLVDGKPFFPASECAKILGYSRPADTITDHCMWSVKRRVPHPQSPGKTIEMKYIPEGDLYRLIIRSRLPSAERFECWVFDEVLPSIRKHGAYVTDEVLDSIVDSPELAYRLFQRLQAEKDKNTVLQTSITELAPKARYYDLILQSKNAVQISVIAKDYGMSAVAFNRLLHDMRIQYKMGGTWLLYQEHANQGYTKSRTYHASENTSVTHTYWTQKGRLFLYERLKECGFVPLMESLDASDYHDQS